MVVDSLEAQLPGASMKQQMDALPLDKTKEDWDDGPGQDTREKQA
jgi:hypothetical protein